MNYFLITYVDTPKSDVGVTPQIFKLSRKCGPDEVTVPERTLCFIFVQSNLQTVEQLKETIIEVGIGNLTSIIHSADSKVISSLYCIGKEYSDDQGKKWISNPYTRTRLASALLWKDYKVIDM